MEKPIAIKVLKLQQKDALKSLMAECDVLKNARHRNLVKLLSFYSSTDYNQNEFKALIFEFMENGSLDEWLHRSGNLSFLQRLSIAIDAASALHYLHDLYETPIIHCNLKPSNVLIDKDMVAHVSDFGLAKFLPVTSDISSQSQRSTTGIWGTVGYSPPEYAMGSPASKEGDVYSYGIVLLELFTGKRPVDLMFKDGMNLHSFVSDALPDGVWQIVDETLVTGEMEERSEARRGNNGRSGRKARLEKCLVSVFEVGIACSRESPKERIGMEDAVNKLDSIKSALVG